MVQTRLHKHSLSKKEQAVSSVASRASVRDSIDEFQDVYGSRAASAAFRQQLGSDFSRSGQSQPPIQAKPSFRGLSQELAPIQAKLTVGPANDIYEQEADRVAAQVVQRIHAPVSNSSTQGESVQRKEEENELQLKPIAPIQRKDMSAGGEVSTDLESEINRARGGGQALAPEMRLKMGEAMGADFSGVRVHTDGRADALNQNVGARAFTTGQDLFFKRGEYQPGSRGGQELIAHELTHVVQQMQPPGGASDIRVSNNGTIERGEQIQRVIVGKGVPGASKFASDRGGEDKKLKGQYENFYNSAAESIKRFTIDQLDEILRVHGPVKGAQVVREMAKAEATEEQTELGGTGAHWVERHLSISDRELEDRLSGANAVDRASRFEQTEWNLARVRKLLNVIANQFPSMLLAKVRLYAHGVHNELNDAKYKNLAAGARKTYLENTLTDRQDEVEDWFDVAYIPEIRVQGNAGNQVRLKVRYTITSIDDYSKETMMLDGGEQAQMTTESSAAEMHSGRNSPLINISVDNSYEEVAASVEESCQLLGVTLF